MKFVAHRINTIEALKGVPGEYGVEVDLRDYGDKLVLQHEPFIDGEEFQEYLKHYKHSMIILNIKSEGIEYRVLELIKKYNIREYFFLDSSFPMIYAMTNQGEKNIAIRFSEYEGLDTILAMKGKVKWIWIDCFTKISIDKENFSLLKDAGFNLCLVSPELQGHNQDLESYKDYLSKENINVDAVCTKLHNIKLWNG